MDWFSRENLNRKPEMFPDLVHGFSWFVCSLKNQSIEGLKLCSILDVMKPKESTWMGPRLGRADVPTTSGRFLCLVHTTAFWTVGPCTNPIFYTDPCLFTWTITQQKWRYNVQEIFVLVMFCLSSGSNCSELVDAVGDGIFESLICQRT